MDIRITLSEHQARLIKKALDLYSRLLIGQVEELEYVFRNFSMLPPKTTYNQMDLKKVSEIIPQLKAVTFPQHPMNGSFSIGNPEVHDSARQMVDIQDVIEHALYNPEKDPSMHRAKYEPFHHSKETPLPIVEKLPSQKNYSGPMKFIPLNWNYDFHQHDWEHGSSTNPDVIKANVEMLRQLEKALKDGKTFEATTDSGSPKVGWGKVVRLEMSYPWPWQDYKHSVPTIVIERKDPMSGQLKKESFCFTSLSDIREV